MRLAGKNMLVTGGASGIGLATVTRCLKEGANVVLSDLDSSDGAARAQALNDAAAPHGGRCLFVPCDVAHTQQVGELVDETVAQLGRLDAVFNNAGVAAGAPAHATDDATWLHVIDINLNGVFRVARAVLPVLYKQRSGNIVNCASILGVLGQSGTAAYASAKAGVVNLTRTLALEAAPLGVRVNAIGPGYIDTPLIKHLEPAQREALIRLHPLGRLGRDEEVANAVLFLASDEASFVTGTCLLVDGGFTAGKS
ncbi:short-chain dehydrogenase [Comamonas serinivorans]|uniref:Short-chain dehydrogenase n=1 Tax=Comamonas serinivorans TaxID=1082851 RepID=A0A1Y0EK65_9BURK|nr:SDR family NAD(P)-dependent oxidoreductase [Comamonas serinivorans]ARU03759.1 short-chain dehydrogenase [Comamonas serinivorans]